MARRYTLVCRRVGGRADNRLTWLPMRCSPLPAGQCQASSKVDLPQARPLNFVTVDAGPMVVSNPHLIDALGDWSDRYDFFDFLVGRPAPCITKELNQEQSPTVRMVRELSTSRFRGSLELLTIASVGHLALPEERRGILKRVSSGNCDSYPAHRSRLVSLPGRQGAKVPIEGLSPREAAMGLRFLEPRGDIGADRLCGAFDFPDGSPPEGVLAYNQAIEGVVEGSVTDPDGLNEALHKAFFLSPVGQVPSLWPCNGLPFYCDGRLSGGLQEHLWRSPVPDLHIQTCVSGVFGAVVPVVSGDEGDETSPFTGTIRWQTIEQHNAPLLSLDHGADINDEDRDLERLLCCQGTLQALL